jgi:DNA polymerase III delta subunit
MVVVDDADQFITPKRRSSAETRAGEEDGSADEDEGDAEGGSRRPMVERYVQSPSEMVTLVLRAPGWRKGKLDALIAAVGVIKECEPLEAGRAANWTATRAKQAYGRDMRVEAVERLVEALDGSLARIDGELQKLAAAAPPGEAITLEMVERLVAPVAAERKPWELADCLLNPDPSVGLGKLHQLMEESGIDPVPLRWGCIDLASKVHAMAHEIAGGVPPAGAGRGLKFFFGPRAEAGRRAAAALGPRSAAALLRECVEADWRGKTGQEDPARGLEALVLRFAEVARLSAGRGVGR